MARIVGAVVAILVVLTLAPIVARAVATLLRYSGRWP